MDVDNYYVEYGGDIISIWPDPFVDQLPCWNNYSPYWHGLAPVVYFTLDPWPWDIEPRPTALAIIPKK